jgi:hypothetical protein
LKQNGIQLQQARTKPMTSAELRKQFSEQKHVVNKTLKRTANEQHLVDGMKFVYFFLQLICPAPQTSTASQQDVLRSLNEMCSPANKRTKLGDIKLTTDQVQALMTSTSKHEHLVAMVCCNYLKYYCTCIPG